MSEKEKTEKIHDQGPVSCPFCDENGFDRMGLKAHLERGYCEIYPSIRTLGIR